ncbi:cytochrome C biogenesis protein [Labilibacter sediminis]|nr:cytochrome C biogenesis protein [Labilibacter sediminis]
MKKIISFLSASYVMGALFIILAAAMGIATFVENDFGTNAAKALYYNAWWFEGIFVLLGINMFFNMIKPYLWTKGKLPVLLFHLAFFIIIAGAAITRYYGFEGMMHIREGESTNEFISSVTYVDGVVEKNGEVVAFSEDVLMSEKSKDNFSKSVRIGGEKVKLKSIDFIKRTKLIPQEDPNGKPLLSLVISGTGGRRNVDLFKGEKITVGSYTVGFMVDEELDFNIFQQEDQLYFKSLHDVFITDMGTQQKTELDMSEPQVFYQRVLYGAEEFFMVQTNYLEGALLKAVAAEKNEQGNFMESLVVKVEKNDQERELTIQGRSDLVGPYDSLIIDGVKIKLSYGAKVLQTPFEIHLNVFQLERYPGSESPSSFASEVTLKDQEAGVERDFRIFMNNILNYKGYRFYQSSYDMDEKGTVLSVNKDLAGTVITYIGYFLLALSMFLSLFASKSRFRYLWQKVNEISAQRKALLLVGLMGLSTYAEAQNIDEYITVSEEQSKKFGELWVQDNGGRIKPMNTMSGEVMRKLVKHNSFKGYSADRVVLSMLSNGEAWEKVPLITVKEGPVRDIVGNAEKKASFSQFFGQSGNYKLHELVEQAYRTKPAYRNKLQNEVIKIDEQVNVFHLARSGKLLKMFPDANDEQAPWLTPGDYRAGIEEGDSLFIRNIFSFYLHALEQGKDEDALSYLDAISKYQNKFAANILPSDKMKQMEVSYNKSNLFLMIAPGLFVLGLILLILQFIWLFMPHKSPKIVNASGTVLFLVAFVIYTVGLGLRWYISGHAPWSNGYESMLYIGWSILVAGLVFSRKSAIVLSIAGLFSGIVLFVAHLSWMNPEITNLVPVLKSYWLTIHVAVIVMSYGFLGIAAFIGFFNLIVLGIKKNTDGPKLDLTITELTSIMEMGLTIGLYMMTIGSFLGGIWANESWGRYWGWDPKETWSLVTIMVYAFILHMRFIPGLKSQVVFNVVTVLGFFSVIMTYLGVNYYLAGMHSYAKGDPVPVPDFVYYTVITVLVVSGYALYNSYMLKKKA